MTKTILWSQPPNDDTSTPPPTTDFRYRLPVTPISCLSPTQQPSGGRSHVDFLTPTNLTSSNITMSQYYGAPPPNQGYAPEAQNLQFYQSSYAQPVSGHATPSQASYGYNAPPAAGGYGVSSGFNSGFGGAAGISGRMGEQGGLRTGWLAALSTEGYDGEPPLLEELGIKPANIRAKVLRPCRPSVQLLF